MAIIQKYQWFDLSQHRTWEDIGSMLLAVVLLLSPMAIPVSDSVAVNLSTGLTAVVIFGLAGLEVVSLRRWEEVLEILCGAWLVVAPFALDYGGAQRGLHIVIGILVALLGAIELWQDRKRMLEG